jgi:hypothetical protein
MFPARKRYHKNEFNLYQNCEALAKSVKKTFAILNPPSFYTRARLAAGSGAVLPRLTRHCCQATSMGEATAIDE